MATITCPECGKKLHITDSRRDFAFCEYCGAKIEIAPFVRNAAEPSEPAEPAEKRDCGHTAADVVYRLVDAFTSPFEERRTKSVPRKNANSVRQKQPSAKNRSSRHAKKPTPVPMQNTVLLRTKNTPVRLASLSPKPSTITELIPKNASLSAVLFWFF